jgi:hypothetical protein
MTSALAATLLASGASAATLNFMAEANGNERGVSDGYVLNSVNTDFTNVTLSANGSNYAYFDSGNAGLGVCSVLTTTFQCNPANDDNVTVTEAVTIAFDAAMTLSGLLFRAEGHVPLASATQTLLFGTNGGTLARYTFSELIGLTFSNVLSATFAFDDAPFSAGADARNIAQNAEQFYLQSATVVPGGGILPPVPVPATAPLLLGALGLFGVGMRRLKKRSA